MVVVLPYIEFELGPAEAHSLDRLAGWTLTSVSARVWLTEESGGRDIWLLPGDRHFIASAGRVVVESWPQPGAVADRTARIRLAPPATSFARQWRWPKFSHSARPCQMGPTAQLASST